MTTTLSLALPLTFRDLKISSPEDTSLLEARIATATTTLSGIILGEPLDLYLPIRIEILELRRNGQNTYTEEWIPHPVVFWTSRRDHLPKRSTKGVYKTFPLHTFLPDGKIYTFPNGGYLQEQLHFYQQAQNKGLTQEILRKSSPPEKTYINSKLIGQ